MNLENYSNLSHYSGFIPSNNQLPRTPFVSRYASLGAAAILAVIPVPLKGEPELVSVGGSVRSSEQTVLTAKQELGSLFEKLRTAIKNDPTNKQALIVTYLAVAFDDTKGISLAESLKNQDPKIYQSMIASILRLAPSDTVVKEEIARLTDPNLVARRVNPLAEEQSTPPQLVHTSQSEAMVLETKLDLTTLPHCIQPKTSLLCGIVSSMTISQAFHGFDLSANEEMRDDLARLTSIAVLRGRSGTTSQDTLSKLGIVAVSHNPEGLFFSTDKKALEYAEGVLNNQILAVIKQGGLASIGLRNYNSMSHLIAIVGYSESEKKFYVSDPMKDQIILSSAREIAGQWSARIRLENQSHIFSWLSIDGSQLPLNCSKNGETYLKQIPDSGEVTLDQSCLSFIDSDLKLSKDEVITFHITKAIQDSNFRFTWLASNWEKNKELDCLQGLRSVIRLSISSNQIKQANGLASDAFIVFIPERSNVQAVAITGFKNGGEGLQYQVVSKKETTWMNEMDLYKLMLKCSNNSLTPSGATCGYYKMSLPGKDLVLSQNNAEATDLPKNK